MKLLDKLKTLEGQSFLKAILKFSKQLAVKDALDILVVACESLSTFLFDIFLSDRRFKARRFVESFVSFEAGDFFMSLLKCALEPSYKKFKDAFLLGKKDEAKPAFEDIFRCGSLDALMNINMFWDSLWSREGLSFMLLTTHLKSVPKAWKKILGPEEYPPLTRLERFSYWWDSHVPRFSKLLRFT